MTLSEVLFHKKNQDLELADIEHFFKDDQKEGNTIEFKSYDSQDHGGFKETYKKVLQSVCAFLNTDGGILIWGAPAGKKKDGDKEESYLLPLQPVPHLIENDQFINTIAGRIVPLSKGVSFKRISTGKDISGKETFVYIIEVQKSDFPPHQVDGTYFMRSEASTRIQPHQFVEAQMKKISFPKLETVVDFGAPFLIPTTSNIIIPFSMIIYNQSHFINEKKLQYRLIGGPCDLIENINTPFNRVFRDGFDITIDGKEILHKNMPLYQEYCLGVNNTILYRHENKISFSVAVWGELSPVVSSNFEFKVLFEGQNPVSLEFTKKEENQYLWEGRGEGTLNENHRTLTNDYSARVRESSFYNSLKNRQSR